jgi:hypothetical protein
MSLNQIHITKTKLPPVPVPAKEDPGLLRARVTEVNPLFILNFVIYQLPQLISFDS